MPGPRSALPLVVVALLVAGCSGGGSGDKAGVVDPGLVASPSPTDSPETVKARAVTLQPGDFPAGFEPQPEEPGTGLDIDRLWGELTRCLGVDTAAERRGLATSPTFKRNLATQARATVEYASEPSANAVAAAFAGPKSQSCLNDAFNADVKRSAPQGGVPGTVAVAPLAAPSFAASKVASFRINVSINLAELTVPLHQDFVVSAERGVLVRMWFLNAGSEFPQDLERSLVQKVVARA